MDEFDYLSEFDVEEFLEESQDEERERLEKELERIDEQLEERRQVHHEIVDELESKIDWYSDRLEMLYKQRRGRNGERSQLKDQINLFYQRIREEKQQHWQDKQRLEEERRNLLRSLDELNDSDLLRDVL